MKKMILVGVLALCACSHEKPVVVSAPISEAGKREAPVAVEATVQDGSASLKLTFENAGEKVFVYVSGKEGLGVKTPPELMNGQTVAAKETKTLSLELNRTTGRNELVVSVEGVFAGSKLMRVVTFTLGEGPLKQSGVKVETDDGQRFKVMKASPPPGESNGTSGNE